MNQQSIIDWQLEQLNQQKHEEMPELMKLYLSQHPELQQELNFITEFWTSNDQLQQPSEQLRTNFYSMLANAKQAHSAIPPKKTAASISATWNKLKLWLSPQPFLQFSALGCAFLLGVLITKTPTPVNDGMSDLQHEVASLSTVVALSLLDKSSASERLSGVAYSQQSDMTDPLLIDTLITKLATDKSTAVRLAIINALMDTNGHIQQQDTLLTLALNESNPLVQMELCRLLLSKGSSTLQKQLLDELSNVQVSDDVRSFVNEIRSSAQI